MGLIDRYRSQLKNLLPQGHAWSAGIGSNLHNLLDGLAVEAARLHDRALDLLDEMDPGRATELLVEWETVWGLPDPCTGQLDTIGDRRIALISRVTSVGGQTPAYFISLAAAIGFTVTVDENVGGDPTVWRINAPATTVRWARAGQSRAGDQIRQWGNELLECTILQVNPAHLTVLFAYA